MEGLAAQQWDRLRRMDSMCGSVWHHASRWVEDSIVKDETPASQSAERKHADPLGAGDPFRANIHVAQVSDDV